MGGDASHGACSGSAGAINTKASSAPSSSLPTMQLFPKEPTAVMSLMLQVTEVVKQVAAEEEGLVTGNTQWPNVSIVPPVVNTKDKT